MKAIEDRHEVFDDVGALADEVVLLVRVRCYIVELVRTSSIREDEVPIACEDTRARILLFVSA